MSELFAAIMVFLGLMTAASAALCMWIRFSWFYFIVGILGLASVFAACEIQLAGPATGGIAVVLIVARQFMENSAEGDDEDV